MSKAGDPGSRTAETAAVRCRSLKPVLVQSRQRPQEARLGEVANQDCQWIGGTAKSLRRFKEKGLSADEFTNGRVPQGLMTNYRLI